ncbi:MAG: ribonuclease Y [Deltaproteobacteria bacterium]|nr:ribonuclease Y [Deltaproteobacteria bacterium]
MEWAFLAGGVLIGAAVAYFLARRRALEDQTAAKAEAERILAEARKQAEVARLEALTQSKQIVLEAKDEAERETKDLMAQHARAEERLHKREENLERKNELCDSREREIANREKAIQKTEEQAQARLRETERLADDQRRALEKVAGMSADEARQTLVKEFVEEAKRLAARDARSIEDAAREEAEQRAKRVIAIAVQRYAGEHVQERTVSTIHLPNDELKGRLIGREGRNIRAIEAATGCDLVVDDTPETVVVTGFDPVRREVARIAVERLIQDGRIHPTKIEELVAKAQADVDRQIREAAEQACSELGVTRVHPEIMKLLGQLKFRFSYAQNVLRHSVECGFVAGMLAAELRLNVRLAKRAALLHDIGKAVSHEQEGGHAMIGGAMAKKLGEDPIVVNAIAAHHDDEPPAHAIAHLVAAADAISSARPGARREMLESYMHRLEELERISQSFPGVERSFAIQAGREVRVFVEGAKIADLDAITLSRDIARKIEEELTYPGQIRVTVIRETRAVEYAR